MKQGWEIKKLGEVCDFQGGSQPPKEEWIDEPREGYVRMLQIRDFTQSRSFDIEYVKESNRLKYCNEDDVLLGRYGASVGKVLTGLAGAYNVAIMKTMPNKDLLNKSYFKYFLESPSFQVFLQQASTMRAAQAGFSKEDIQDFTIPVPPREEQERIVAELDCLSGIIEKKREQLRELDALAQSIFYQMFGDPITNEKGWEIKNMEELFDIGSSKRVFESQWTNSGIPFYRAREIVRLSKNEQIEDPIYISETLYKEYSQKYGVPKLGDIMVTAVGTLGTCYLIDNDQDFYFKDGNILWFKSKGFCKSRFIKDQYATDFVVAQIRGNANAAVVGTYTIMNAKKTKVIVPPIELQASYVEKVEYLDKQKTLISQSIKEVEDLFNSRMSYYFN